MKKSVLFLLLCIGSVVMLSGCASLNGDVPFRYQPSLISTTQTINKSVGINMIVDKRPDGDVAYTKSIKDITEKVTSKLIEDFEKSKIFTAVHYPAQPGDDIVINGTLDRFMWKLYSTPISYIPGINLVIYFGVPCYEAYGIAGITLEAKDNKAGGIVKTIVGSSRVDTEYTLYNFVAGDAGSELSEAFRDVAKKLKEGLLMEFNK